MEGEVCRQSAAIRSEWVWEERAALTAYAFIGWLASFTPSSKGYYLSALILVGKDLPEKVAPLNG